MDKIFRQLAKTLSIHIPQINTPVRITLASFVLSELMTAAIVWLFYGELSATAFIIAGVCSITAPFLLSSRILRQQQTIRQKNQQLRKLAQQFRQANRRLSERNAQLDAFSYTVAHDLQAPLGAVDGLSRHLEENYLRISEDMVRQHLRMIGRTTQKMSRIVDELLLLSRIQEASTLPLKSLDMGSIVREAREHVIHTNGADGAKFFVPDSWPIAIGYAPWVERVWINYLSNALKYGGRPPMVRLGADAGPHNIRFWVQDNGLGLSKEEQEGLFVPFKRLGATGVQGHGLGLAIVRNIVERLGGKTGVESSGVRGQGCCFYFTLPRAVNMTAGDTYPLQTPQQVSNGMWPETATHETVFSVNMIEQQS